ncbi:glycosyltransferase family 4 protein [Clostridium perfringens]|uniref:glycosyltransferase family 4 protein n=1 Tax=Clostridium perfringens TaxID=1502 RepID=UPI0024BD5A19|nr:glycosyltransferase family 4 protein [Clostridium perfringens]MDK0822924.1 glycosyltransferase family 4 protein [Clostridium perfringens]
MDNILIISGTDKISGAEFVLKDYIEKSHYKNNIHILCSGINEVKEFYKGFSKNVFEYKGLNPVNATKSKFGVKNKFKKVLNIYSTNRYLKKFLDYRTIIGNNTRDIVYSNFINNKTNKFYLFIHDMILDGTINQKLIKIFDKNVYKYIAVSNAVKDSLVNSGVKKEKIILQYNGLEYIEYNERKLNKQLTIGFIGALIERKSPKSMVKFIEKSKFKGKMVFNYYDEKILNGIKEEIFDKKINIELIGKLERSLIPDFIKSVDYIFVPSKEDPLPTVVLESLNESVPVIGRCIDGIPEMISDRKNGFLFNNDSQLEELIKILGQLDEEKYCELCKNSNETIKDKFNIKRKVENLDRLFFKL